MGTKQNFCERLKMSKTLRVLLIQISVLITLGYSIFHYTPSLLSIVVGLVWLCALLSVFTFTVLFVGQILSVNLTGAAESLKKGTALPVWWNTFADMATLIGLFYHGFIVTGLAFAVAYLVGYYLKDWAKNYKWENKDL